MLGKKDVFSYAFKEAVEYFNLKEKEKIGTEKQKTNPIPEKYKNVKPDIRSIEEYCKIIGGIGQWIR
ncbi:hypothetical protein [Caloramator sp. Dgby_cultured_2]|uniref:hypothetical protein n=1 Tax=Caloramator sp. Dgby_cultured_2 TaxID=3029174 RepID=UPI00237EBA25|nr:hypothetical protein [Caloramator sp. Dgby_cultured_2]WDU82505.1 hypothetical protein PWK10_12915 [Caloramator sp. Dgby_cultured_2]